VMFMAFTALRSWFVLKCPYRRAMSTVVEGLTIP
jgi:hypothetical protein